MFIGMVSQEVFDEHFIGTSATERGTLFHLKQYLKKKGVAGDVMTHFTADWEFLEVVLRILCIYRNCHFFFSCVVCHGGIRCPCNHASAWYL
jgi:hypothetical protein